MSEALQKAKRARNLQQSSPTLTHVKRNKALIAIAQKLREKSDAIIKANAIDVQASKDAGVSEALVDRLTLDEGRLESIAQAAEAIAQQPDPLGQVLGGSTLDNGIRVEKITVPLGVVAIIYESRPNVTVDAACLSIKTGNALILRGASSALNSNKEIVAVMRDALVAVDIDPDFIQLIESSDRAESRELMKATGLIDVLIPRGGASLIATTLQESTVPVIETGTGNCHIYLEKTAQSEWAHSIVINAKTQRPGVCNAVETLLVDRDLLTTILPQIAEDLIKAGVELRGDESVVKALSNLDITAATQEDWATEYLDLILAIKAVDGVDEAIRHINKYGTSHSEAIITSNYQASEEFLARVDAASLFVNASTRFTDGEMFGLGAELGISTQKLHARGPMGASVLTTTKYISRGDGQVRG